MDERLLTRIVGPRSRDRVRWTKLTRDGRVGSEQAIAAQWLVFTATLCVGAVVSSANSDPRVEHALIDRSTWSRHRPENQKD